jgi:hypothetical protein
MIWVPEGLKRVSVQKPTRSRYVTVTSTGAATQQTPPLPAPVTLEERISRLDPAAKWALQHLHISDNGESIAAAIQDRVAIAVSDGGLKLGLGTAAYVIEAHGNTLSSLIT